MTNHLLFSVYFANDTFLSCSRLLWSNAFDTRGWCGQWRFYLFGAEDVYRCLPDAAAPDTVLDLFNRRIGLVYYRSLGLVDCTSLKNPIHLTVSFLLYAILEALQRRRINIFLW